MAYVLGLDLGTSSLKGLLMNEKGESCGTATADYPLLHPASGYSEQIQQSGFAHAKSFLKL